MAEKNFLWRLIVMKPALGRGEASWKERVRSIRVTGVSADLRGRAGRTRAAGVGVKVDVRG